MNVLFCASCRALILSGFRFCPYCGVEVPKGPGIEEALSRPFGRIEAERGDGPIEAAAGPGPEASAPASGAAASDPAEERFAAAWEELRRLEAEMECLIEGERDRQRTEG